MLTILLAALAGGVILNVMPCVLPVLALKAFTVVEHAKHDDRKRRLHGVFYTAGTVSMFLVLGALVVMGKSAGRHLGWGMQFQHAPFVAAMIAIVFVFALNALGVFEILVSAQGEDAAHDKLWGSFMNGIFASILSTPCSAPFVGSAAAFAFAAKTSAVETLLVFAVMGFGLALPYLLLTLIPAFANVLPRPGPWMETVKTVMGFFLLATALWLYLSFLKQVTPDSAGMFLFFLLGLAVAFWAAHRFGGADRGRGRQWIVRGLALAFAFAVYKGTVRLEPAAQAKPVDPVAAAGDAMPPVVVDGRIAWVAYDKGRLGAELARHRPVFLDFTAEWCATCKANEKAFVETEGVRQAFARSKILPMKVDMTTSSDELDELLDATLKGHDDRNGIPVYVVKFPGGEQDLLPLVITSEMVVGHLDEATKKFPPHQFALAPLAPPSTAQAMQ